MITDYRFLADLELERMWERQNQKAIRRERWRGVWMPVGMLTVLAAIVELWRW